MRPDDDIAMCRDGHRRLVDALAGLSDHDFRSPSLLPRYSRGHVVTHLTNKTKAHVRLFGGPPADEIRRLHPLGYDADLAAAAGAHRAAVDLCSELQDSFARLEGAWHALDDTLWDRQGIMTAGARTMAEIVAHHLRDVEVHHVDLGIGYLPSDWPPRFVDGELTKRLRALPDRAEHAELLAWLLGRARAPELGPW
jgi:maleylpyruvate isomerase